MSQCIFIDLFLWYIFLSLNSSYKAFSQFSSYILVARPAYPLSFSNRNSIHCRSQWPRGLRRRSAAARLLRSWVRIPPGAWIFVCCECCVLSGRGLCDELITRPEESYRLWCVVVCDLETSWMKPWPALGRSATAKKRNHIRTFVGSSEHRSPASLSNIFLAFVCFLCAFLLRLFSDIIWLSHRLLWQLSTCIRRNAFDWTLLTH